MKIKKRGITVVSVLIILVVLAIFATAITISTDVIIKNTHKKEFANEYFLIKSYTNDYITRNSGIIDFTGEKQINITQVDENYRNQFNSDDIEDDKIDTYIIDLDKIGIEKTTYGAKRDGDDDVYVLSKKTHTVYYLKGFKQDGEIYYIAQEY